jgi:hypothetical protein
MNTLSRSLPLTSVMAAGQKLKNYFFENKYDASALVVFRIGTGCILLLQLLQLLPDMQHLMGQSGMIRPDIAGVEIPAYVLSSAQIIDWVSIHAHLSFASASQVLAITYALSILFIIAGLFTRVSSLVCLVLHVAFVYSGHFFSYGVDYFLNIFLFYLFIFPVHTEYALDKYLFRLKPVNATPYIRLLQLHLSIVYFVGGAAKAFGVNWWNGISIWKAINRPSITGYDVRFLADYAWVFTAIGIVTMLIEMLYPVFIHLDRTRKPWLIMTCMLHLSIALVLRLPFFAAVMILFNTVAFYLPQQQHTTK